jgi:hypothetical protein
VWQAGIVPSHIRELISLSLPEEGVFEGRSWRAGATNLATKYCNEAPAV